MSGLNLAVALPLQWEARMHEVCNVCGNVINRDYYVNLSAPPMAEWLGVCECESRKWRWRSLWAKHRGN